MPDGRTEPGMKLSSKEPVIIGKAAGGAVFLCKLIFIHGCKQEFTDVLF
jgi:hypothetical protein